LLFLGLYANAQKVQISGVVTDSLGKPLSLANIMATQKIDSTIADYAIANRKGVYHISLQKGGNYLLTVSFVGMKPTQKEIEIPENAEDFQLNFTLQPATNQLQGVELSYKIPIVVRGDTIVYNTDSFTNGNERNLG